MEKKFTILDGLKIIDDYTTEKAFSAEHDQIWFGDFEETAKRMPLDVKTNLEENNWFEDEESWSHFT